MKKVFLAKGNDAFGPGLSRSERWVFSKPYREYFAQQVKAAQKERGWTNEQFAEELGVFVSQIQKYRNGTNWGDVFHVARIARVLGKPLNYFIHEDLRLDGENDFMQMYMRAYREGKNMIQRK